MSEVLPVSGDLIHAELEGAEKVLAKWREAVGKGIPGVDIPGNDESLHRFLIELCGELLVVAGKCQNLSAVVSDRA